MRLKDIEISESQNKKRMLADLNEAPETADSLNRKIQSLTRLINDKSVSDGEKANAIASRKKLEQKLKDNFPDFRPSSSTSVNTKSSSSVDTGDILSATEQSLIRSRKLLNSFKDKRAKGDYSADKHISRLEKHIASLERTLRSYGRKV